MRKKLQVALLCLSAPSVNLNRFTYDNENIPIACGYLKSYAYSSGLNNEVNIDIPQQALLSLGGDSAIIAYLSQKKYNLLGFTLYQWNALRTLYIIRELKKREPEVKILAGGPEVSPETEYLINEESIDFMIRGEGEEPFRKLLLNFTTKKPSFEEIPGLIYRKNGITLSNSPGEALKDISKIPSPYLSGFIELNFHRTILMETMRGCVYKCKYCNWKLGGRLNVSFFPLERLRQEFILARETGIRRIRILDGSLNISKEWLKDFCNMISKENKDRLVSIRAFINAENIDEESAKWLYEANIDGAIIGLQSTNYEALRLIGRHADFNKYLEGISLLTKYDIECYPCIIIGLPGDTLNGFTKTMNFLTDNNQRYIILFPLSLSPNTLFRNEAKALGIHFQKMPPNLVISTQTMSFNDIKKGIKLFRERFSILTDNGIFEKDIRFSNKNNCPPFHHLHQRVLPTLITYINGIYPKITGNNEETGNPDNLEQMFLSSEHTPLTRLIFSAESRSIKHNSLKRICCIISSNLSWNSLLWLSDFGSHEDLIFLEKLMSLISKENPYHIWHIVIELKREIPPDYLSRISSSIINSPGLIDYESMYEQKKPVKEYRETGPLIQVVIPYGAKQFSKKWIDVISKKVPLFWYLMLPRKHKSVPDEGEGFLIEFSPDAHPSQILYTLNSIRNMPGFRLFFFRNWIIQHLWSLQFSNYLSTWGGDENILEFISDKNIVLTKFNDKMLRKHIINWIKSRKGNKL